jgi:hypothetical protein
MPNMPPVLLEIQYLPPVQYFALLAKHGTLYLEQHEHYKKGSYRNRCHIAAVNGVQRLSIPLQKGKNQQQPIREVRIAYDEAWRPQHWQAIQTAYGNSPFFEHYADILMPFYKGEKYEFLWDWNYDLFLLLLKILKINIEIKITTHFESKPVSALDFRDVVSPKKMNIYEAVYYPQVFEDRLGFLPNLSILDLLFCTGPGAGEILLH